MIVLICGLAKAREVYTTLDNFTEYVQPDCSFITVGPIKEIVEKWCDSIRVPLIMSFTGIPEDILLKEKLTKYEIEMVISFGKTKIAEAMKGKTSVMEIF